MSNDASGNKIRYKQNLSLNGKYGWRTILPDAVISHIGLYFCQFCC